MFNTKELDIRLLIQFVKDQGFDLIDLVEAAKRLEDSLELGLLDYSYKKEN